LHPFSQFQSTITSGRQSKTLFFKVEFSHDIGIKKVGRDGHTLLVYWVANIPLKGMIFHTAFSQR
jgi:hypothetical protein